MLYLSRDSRHQELYILYKRSGSVLSVLLYFTLTKVLAKYSLVILTHLLNKQIVLFDKMCQQSSVL